MTTKTTDEVINMIAEKLRASDGVTIEDAAREVGIECDYQGDSMFIVKEG